MNPTPTPYRRLGLALAAALSLALSGCLDEFGRDQSEHVGAITAAERSTTRAVTSWSEELELFMEYPVLTAGESGRYSTHLTRLEDFSPVTSGPLHYRFEREDGHVEEHLAETMARDGVFLPDIRIEQPGHYQLKLTLGTGEAAMTLEAGYIDVVAPGEISASDYDADAHSTTHDDAPDDIEFLKEQQWRMDFAVRQVSRDTISERLSLSARIEPRPGQSAQATAPVSGRLLPPEDGRWKRPGDRVEAGEVLARILPLSGAEDVGLLNLDLTEARERLALARTEHDRVQGLYRDGVVSEKRLEQAQSEYRVARQALERARARLEQIGGEQDQTSAAVSLRAAITGVITASPYAPGERIAANETAFSLLDDSHVWLKAMAYPGDLARINRPEQLVARQAGGQWQSFPEAELVYIGTRTAGNGSVPLVFDLPNPEGQLIPGTAWSAAFSTGAGQMAVVVPKSAILDDDGIEVVIVQHQGERFERRPVKTGLRSGDRVAITSGLQPGERVVTKGAYIVLLASRGEQDIGHDHAH
ncbi:MAG TPA: efflux RND transporter periplasmic adaptor subunit [Guyparkeria sp.]|nr:efflux RND transporter periplasmic adaptor subunit [Guyparkeria sp.]